ncbi:alpha/beta fold hydrolase [Vibrio gallicus]|uniref:alpha/beta fold hydrolase n=1 Tax=Vibrio gallicus TaxID=190897 RepID=UPI0021C381EB|nr:alpha/beta fold hydrolase [Vibrio gallicus]
MHGFLGSAQDWRSTIQYLPANVEVHCLDIAGHASNQHLIFDSFEQYSSHLMDAIEALSEPNVAMVLIGYSLGARLIMHGMSAPLCEKLNIAQIIIEGGNFGLTQQSDREARWRSDDAWARRFESESLAVVLHD